MVPTTTTQHSGPTLLESQYEEPPASEEDMLVPRRACVDDVKVFKRGDVYIGRGSKQLGLAPSSWGNPFKVKQYGLDKAVDLFARHLGDDVSLVSRLRDLEGKRLLCHCKENKRCHADVLIAAFVEMFPRAFHIGHTDRPPSQRIVLTAARAREEVSRGEVSVPEEGVPAGCSGWRGSGPPMLVGRAGRCRELNDGAGLCSPGRWRLRDRRFPSSSSWNVVAGFIWGAARRWGSQRLFDALSSGQVSSCPFSSEEVRDLRVLIESQLSSMGLDTRERDGDRTSATPRWRLFGALLAAAEDPDAEGITGFVRGVPLGVGVKLPRLPALYRKKAKWRLEEQREVHRTEYVDDFPVFLPNYASAQANIEALRRVLDADVEAGLVERTTREDASRRYGARLRVGSLGAQVKGVDDHGQVVVRVLHDGTREVSVNSRIQVRDQDAGPLAQDLKRVLREQSEVSDQVAGLVVDVKGAHRLIPVREEDWGLQACSLTSDGPVYLNRVGTFGVSSASYWWSRAGGAWVRLAHYVIGGRAPSWLLLVADDLNQSASGPHQVTALMVVLVLAAIVDIPISWHKVKGGQALSWVGYEILLAEHKAGISASRAAWAVRWCREQLESERVLVSRFEEGVGRLSFVAGILDWDRAFLSPLYKFLALEDPGAMTTLPPYVKLSLAYLSESLPVRRHVSCRQRSAPPQSSLRVDAHASAEGVGIGAWLPFVDVNGQILIARSPWLSLEVTPSNAPWAFEHGIETYRLIATLEALAVLLAVKHLLPEGTAQTESQSVAVTQVLTDNRGNGHILSKLHSTKFPISAIVMELAFMLKEKGLQAEVSWIPRESNTEADELSNLDVSRFSPEHRVDVDLANEDWRFFHKALLLGKQYIADALERKNGRTDVGRSKKFSKKDPMKVRDPW